MNLFRDRFRCFIMQQAAACVKQQGLPLPMSIRSDDWSTLYRESLLVQEDKIFDAPTLDRFANPFESDIDTWPICLMVYRLAILPQINKQTLQNCCSWPLINLFKFNFKSWHSLKQTTVCLLRNPDFSPTLASAQVLGLTLDVTYRLVYSLHSVYMRIRKSSENAKMKLLEI